MKKRFFAFFLALTFVIALAGCGKKSPAAEEQKFERGVVENNVYTSNILGMKFELPSEWAFFTDEEILNLNNITEDIVDEEIAKKLESANIIYDMYAISEEEASVNINFESLSVTNQLLLDEGDYVEIGQKDLKPALESMGYSGIETTTGTGEIAGETHPAIEVTANINGIPFYEKVIAKKCGKYMACITIASFGENLISDILAQFSKK